MDKNKLWQAVLGELELSISRPSFKTWFKNTSIAEIKDDGEVIVVSVPNNFSKKWLEDKYHSFILKALRKATDGQTEKVLYKVEARTSKKKTPVTIRLEELKKEVEETAVEERTNGYGLNTRYTFDNFVVGSDNELAHAAAQAVAKGVGKKYNPLFIYGGAGLGKTHLLQAIGHAILKDRPKIKVLYTNAERFTNEFIRAIQRGSLDEFRKIYRDLDVLLLDDIQFIAGKKRTQEEFFHTFNTLYQKDGQIVISSDRPPKAIPALEDRMISRFEWGLIADIQPPDIETRIAILRAKCQEKKYQLDNDILQHLASNVQNNVRELEGALNKIVAYHELHKTPITLELAQKILKSLQGRKEKTMVSAEEVIKVVANFYSIDLKEMISSSRKRELVVPRQVAAYLLREELGSSFPLIGKKLGGRDHTTAMYAYKKVNQQVKEEGRIKQEADLIKERLYNK